MTASTPNNDASLKSLEAELDRSIEKLDEEKEAKERAEAAKQVEESKDDPTPLSDYKKAEAIRKGAI